MGRRAFVIGCIFWGGLGLCRVAQAASVAVSAPRVVLGDLLPKVLEPWASLDMGPAPEPMQQSRITREDIIQRLAQARLPLPPDVVLPHVLRIVRPGQSLSEPQLTMLVRQELIHLLPPGSRIQVLRLSGGVALPPGQIRLLIALPDRLLSGPQNLQVSVYADSTPAHWDSLAPSYQAQKAHQSQQAHPAEQAQQAAVIVTAYVELDLLHKHSRVPVLGRGSEVVVQVRSGGVLVQSSGLAQEPGSIGDIVSVLPNHGGRILHARIVDATTVEVRL